VKGEDVASRGGNRASRAEIQSAPVRLARRGWTIFSFPQETWRLMLTQERARCARNDARLTQKPTI